MSDLERELEQALAEAARASHDAEVAVWRACDVARRLLGGTRVSTGVIVAATRDTCAFSTGAVNWLVQADVRLAGAIALVRGLGTAAATVASMRGGEAVRSFEEGRRTGRAAAMHSCGCDSCEARRAAQRGGPQVVPNLTHGGSA